ncbi:MAG: malectin domain-containing carbohydrate-binding protein [Planctomycetota bacterium]|nr:malectin domain-containing carbohydrate-binding protein [Planctomycetota bacterium]
MADSFDPYHVWLGITPDSQPPNHYRLLGIELFEQSDDVIDAAASRQSMALRAFGTLNNSELSQKLLDEISAARVCLLNNAGRKKYDEKLQSELAEKGISLPESAALVEPKPGYHLWLGITPALQPPTHYQLLGLAAFESSSEVIEAAAQRQSCYLREVSVGKHRKQSQKLLNEVSAARRCLLDLEKKQAYDEQLRRQAEEAAAAKEVAGEVLIQPTESVDAAASVPDLRVPDATVSTSANRNEKKHAEKPASDIVVPSTPALESGDAGAFPVLQDVTRPTEVPDQEATPEPDGDARRKTFIVVASISAAVLLVGAGLLFWLSDSDSETSRKTASTRANVQPADKDSKKDEGRELPASDPGLLAHWKFDEKNPNWAANEVSPLTLTMRGTPEFTAGPVGQAIKLDGKDDVMELPTGSVAARAGTIAFWVRRDSDDGSRSTPLVSTEKSGTQINLSLSDNGQPTGTVGPQAMELTTKVTLVPHQWYHLALTWQQNSQALLYCNAEKIGEVEDAGPFAIPEKLMMGAAADYQDTGNQAVATAALRNSLALASFDDVQCFDRALKADELAALIKGSSVELKPPGVYSGEPETQLAAVSKDGTGSTIAEEKMPEPSKVKPRNSKPAKKPPAPKPPPLRTVQLPQSENNVSSHVWKNVETDQFSQLVSSRPTARPIYRRLTRLAAGTKESAGPNAFQRVRGVLIPPVGGPYKFHIEFVDVGQFLLSSGLESSGLKEVKDGQTVELSGTQTYYFEILQLDKSGKGSFRIGWTFPNGATEQPIPTGRLGWTRHLESFASLPVSRLECSESLTVQQIKDSDVILASGDPRAASTVTVEFQSDVTTYTAFRLDAVVNEELLSNGPGLGSRGMFSLSELSLEYQEPGSTTSVPVPLDAPVAHTGIPASLVDGDVSTSWSVRGRDNESTSVILVPENTITVSPQTTFRLTLHQETPLGLFRFLGTAASATRQVEAMRRQMEQAELPFALHVNLGGPKWTDPEETTWVPSRTYSKGAWGHVGGQPLVRKGPASQAVCLDSAITGINAFRAELPNGRYDVTLFFSEQWVTKPGQRVFTVQIESDRPVRFDSFVSAGSGNKVFAATAPIVVKDGRLDIVFKKVVGASPILNAISITE